MEVMARLMWGFDTVSQTRMTDRCSLATPLSPRPSLPAPAGPLESPESRAGSLIESEEAAGHQMGKDELGGEKAGVRGAGQFEFCDSAGVELMAMFQAAMQHPPYRELFDFRPTSGPAPLLLILGQSLEPSFGL